MSFPLQLKPNDLSPVSLLLCFLGCYLNDGTKLGNTADIILMLCTLIM